MRHLTLLAAVAIQSVAAYLPAVTGVCQILQDPIVVPFGGFDFEFSKPGRTYALNAADMAVVVTIGSHYSSWLSQHVEVVDSVDFSCGNVVKTVTHASLQNAGGIATLTCNTGSCQNKLCKVVMIASVDPYPDIDIIELRYFGSQGVCGICYGFDRECPPLTSTTSGIPTSSKSTSTAPAISTSASTSAVLSTKPAAVTSKTTSSSPAYCKPVSHLDFCQIMEDPIVNPFYGHIFSFDTPGVFWALNSVEMKVQITIGTHPSPRGLVSVIDAISVQCANGPTRSYKSNALSHQGITIDCVSGSCARQGDCYATIMLGDFPVPNVDVQMLVYSGNRGTGGICYSGDTSCPQQYNPQLWYVEPVRWRDCDHNKLICSYFDCDGFDFHPDHFFGVFRDFNIIKLLFASISLPHFDQNNIKLTSLFGKSKVLQLHA
ncbi:hypothetical protein HDU98_010636 [Podochytrium sp. JEL0797]|nr:hypothetical protein HDU98_010636 [Podochytrium sp. JEL0797]